MADLPFGITYTQMMSARRALEKAKMPFTTEEVENPIAGAQLDFVFDRFIVVLGTTTDDTPRFAIPLRNGDGVTLRCNSKEARKARRMLSEHFGFECWDPPSSVARRGMMQPHVLTEKRRAWRP